jgi:hypothetical protein
MITTEKYKKAKAILAQYEQETEERAVACLTKAIKESGLLGERNFKINDVFFCDNGKFSGDIDIRITYLDSKKTNN